LRLFLANPGRSVGESQRIAQSIKRWSDPTEAVVAMAASSAVFVALACDRLVMEPFGRFYLHRPYGERRDGSRCELSEATETVLMAMLTTELAARSRRPASFWESEIRPRGEWWVHADEAVELGLADAVLDAPTGYFKIPARWEPLDARQRHAERGILRPGTLDAGE
jgi:ATP-dependent protease ClpP protease subunit